MNYFFPFYFLFNYLLLDLRVYPIQNSVTFLIMCKLGHGIIDMIPCRHMSIEYDLIEVPHVRVNPTPLAEVLLCFLRFVSKYLLRYGCYKLHALHIKPQWNIKCIHVLYIQNGLALEKNDSVHIFSQLKPFSPMYDIPFS